MSMDAAGRLLGDAEVGRLIGELEKAHRHIRLLPPSGERARGLAIMLRQAARAMRVGGAETRIEQMARVSADVDELRGVMNPTHTEELHRA